MPLRKLFALSDGVSGPKFQDFGHFFAWAGSEIQARNGVFGLKSAF